MISVSSVSSKSSKIPGGLKIIGCMSLSIAAFASRTPYTLGLLFLCNILAIILFNSPFIEIVKECKFFIFQCIIIVLLYILKFGWAPGFKSGLLLSLQFVFFLLPGIILSHSITPAQTAKSLSLVMPHYLAFVLSVCLHFIHILLEEIREIYEAQLLRGAKISSKELMKPSNWKDLITCLLIPTIIYGFSMARQISFAAKSRAFNIYQKRTYWNGHYE